VIQGVYQRRDSAWPVHPASQRKPYSSAHLQASPHFHPMAQQRINQQNMGFCCLVARLCFF